MTTWEQSADAVNRAFADGVRMERVGRRWTQDDLAARWKVSRPAVAKIESGVRRATLGDMFTACSIFGVDAPDLLLRRQHDLAVAERTWAVVVQWFPQVEDRKPFYNM